MYCKCPSVLFISIIFLIASSAYGYIDMSTGSYVIQIVVAGFLGAIFTLKGFIRQLFGKVTKFLKGK